MAIEDVARLGGGRQPKLPGLSDLQITATTQSPWADGTRYRLRVSYYGYLRDWAYHYRVASYDYQFTTQRAEAMATPASAVVKVKGQAALGCSTARIP
jgi:hypothetical protein